MRTRGFTLIELLVVVIIITTLTAVALPSYRRSIERSHSAEVVQMLPVLFESRERWLVLNLCRWTGTNLSCVYIDNLPLSFNKLDVEVQEADPSNSTLDTQTFQTVNYEYKLVDGTPSSGGAPCVSAKAKWGGRMQDKVTIYYNGDKFSCKETQAGLCDILNITPESNDPSKGCEDL